MAHSERHEELVALAALGALGAEREDFRRQMAEGCLECETLLSELRLTSSALAAQAPLRAPRPELKQRVLDAIAGPRPVARPATPPLAAWLLAAAAALLFVVVSVDDARLRRQREELQSREAQLAGRLEQSERELARRDLRVRVLESEDVRILFLGGQGPQPDARAKVFWSERAKRGFLVAANLEPLPPDKQYELWVFDKGKPVPAGVFDADVSGRALFESPDLAAISAAQNFAVTVEPRGGVPQPTGPIVLVGTPSA
jgi:anti-sigma-K factor RskA